MWRLCLRTRLPMKVWRILLGSRRRRKCLGASQFVISKQRQQLEQFPHLFPISPLPSTLLSLLLLANLPVYSPCTASCKSAAGQTLKSKERRRHIEPIEPDRWCNAPAIYPQSHIIHKLPPERRECSLAISSVSRYKERSEVIIEVNGWKKDIRN